MSLSLLLYKKMHIMKHIKLPIIIDNDGLSHLSRQYRYDSLFLYTEHLIYLKKKR